MRVYSSSDIEEVRDEDESVTAQNAVDTLFVVKSMQ